jgi:LuxR family transcriptional regulator, maltose regulon positive regulatory protein
VALCRQLGHASLLAAGLVSLAWIRQAQGDPAGATETMGETERILPDPGLVELFNPAPAQAARLALAQGRTADAARWVRERRLGVEDEPSYPREPAYLVLARVLLAEHQPKLALGLVERWLALAVTQGRTASIIELRALQALAYAACGDAPAALDALAEALVLGWPEGYLRVFVDEGAPLATLLDTLTAAGPRGGRALQLPPDYLRRLTDAFERAGVASSRRGRRGAVPGLVEPLSERELEVLALLATGRSNQQIAEELVVALDTVKSTSATSWTRWGWPTAPRPWPAPGSCSCSGRPARAAASIARWCMLGRRLAPQEPTSDGHHRVMAPPGRVASVP